MAYNSSSSFGGTSQTYDPVLWSLTPKGVAEPGTLAVLGLGLAGIGALRRRKAA